MEPELSDSCKDLPNLLSSFVDTLIDFSVSGGLFLPPESPPPPPATRYPAPSRLIAIGDLHGDLEKTKQAFRLAGLIDGSDRWSGGSPTVVQVGDVFDRGGDELKILYFLEKLKREAAKSGGELITMNGNHEIMNVEADFRFVTRSGLQEFEDWAFWYRIGQKMKSLCSNSNSNSNSDIFDSIPSSFLGVKQEAVSGIRSRIAALRPGGPVSTRFLTKNQTVVVVGDSVFVHGGLLSNHVEYGLERINDEVREWLNGSTSSLSSSAPSYCKGRDAVVWLRRFSEEAPEKCDCSALEHVLATIPGVKRMIMGHTIQEGGINGICENRAIRIDVGLSKGCGNGLPEVLEIDGTNSQVRILTANPLFREKNSYKGSIEDSSRLQQQVVEVKA